MYTLRYLLRCLAAWATDLADDLEPVDLWKITNRVTGAFRYVMYDSGYALVEEEVARISLMGGKADVWQVTMSNRAVKRIPDHRWAE